MGASLTRKHALIRVVYINDEKNEISMDVKFKSLTKVRAEDLLHSYLKYINNICIKDGNMNNIVDGIKPMLCSCNNHNIEKFNLIHYSYKIKKFDVQISSNKHNRKTGITVFGDYENGGATISNTEILKIKIYNDYKEIKFKKNDSPMNSLGYKIIPEENRKYSFYTSKGKTYLPLVRLDNGNAIALINISGNEYKFSIINIDELILKSPSIHYFSKNGTPADVVVRAFDKPFSKSVEEYGFRFFVDYRIRFNNRKRRLYLGDVISKDGIKYFISDFTYNNSDNNINIVYIGLDNPEVKYVSKISDILKNECAIPLYKYMVPFDNVEKFMDSNIVNLCDTILNIETDKQGFKSLCEILNLEIDRINSKIMVPYMNYNLLKL